MKRLIYLLATALCLCCCTRPQRTVTSESSKKVEVDSMADKIKATLAVYLKDSIDKDFYQGFISHAPDFALSHNVSVDSMNAVYNANIEHVDSLVRSAFLLIDSGRLKDCWEMIGKRELKDFYQHPSNTVDNELQFHQAMIYMNDKFLDKQAALERNIKMWEFSDIHCTILETKNSDYLYPHLFVLEHLALAYKEAADSTNAVETAKRFKTIYDELYPDNPGYANGLVDYVK